MATDKQLSILRKNNILAEKCSIEQAKRIIEALEDAKFDEDSKKVKDAVRKNGARYRGVEVTKVYKSNIVKLLDDDYVENIDELHPDDEDYVFFEIETTGIVPKVHEIIEYIGIKYHNGEEVDRLHIYIKPKREFDVNYTNKVTWENVKDGMDIESALRKITSFQKGQILVSHNMSFDSKFLNYNLNKYFGVALPNELVCTLKLSRLKIKDIENHKLPTLIKHLGIANDKNEIEDATTEVELTLELWNKLKDI